MKTIGRLIVVGLVIFALLQFVRPGIPTKPATAEIQAPPEAKRILEKDCYSCHSDQRRLAWFDQVVPAYWLVRHDVLTAREHLNFSTIGAKPAAQQRSTLFEAVNMMQLGAMPLPQFVQIHPEAKVLPEDLATLKIYLAPWAALPPAAASTTANPTMLADLTKITPEFNGLPFDPGFEGWKLLSTTDRGDNNTFRFILGNDVAVKAALSGNVSPWPDGARFAKIAWQQELAADGLVHPGKFIQVEFMVKSAQQYKDTEGWGWGRWRGMDLKPYGDNAQFVTECTSCHQPLRGNDYVYTLPMSNANVSRDEVLNRSAAALPSSLPYQPLAWNAITMFVDPKTHTMATLYGNDAAMQAVHARGTASSALTPAYGTGAVLALVTWVQREDPHWFGARIPDSPKSVEFVQFVDQQHPTYRRFAGIGLNEDHSTDAPRTDFILRLIPAPLP